jgi:hypothetical protein
VGLGLTIVRTAAASAVAAGGSGALRFHAFRSIRDSSTCVRDAAAFETHPASANASRHPAVTRANMIV